jgi:hypothetical protein
LEPIAPFWNAHPSRTAHAQLPLKKKMIASLNCNPWPGAGESKVVKTLEKISNRIKQLQPTQQLSSLKSTTSPVLCHKQVSANTRNLLLHHCSFTEPSCLCATRLGVVTLFNGTGSELHSSELRPPPRACFMWICVMRLLFPR